MVKKQNTEDVGLKIITQKFSFEGTFYDRNIHNENVTANTMKIGLKTDYVWNDSILMHPCAFFSDFNSVYTYADIYGHFISCAKSK